MRKAVTKLVKDGRQIIDTSFQAWNLGSQICEFFFDSSYPLLFKTRRLELVFFLLVIFKSGFNFGGFDFCVESCRICWFTYRTMTP